ncbi:hypothetical protein MNB_SV-3-176 [hydrothermal vent metagenome]|uniref:DUF3971 domain-containing protein n=1 Tax=hydrothermal vent metagenome TaxID=652676 RepID=A0A1W1BRW7_9ZZZZ
MQMVKKVMLILLFVWFSLLLFMPKTAFYYTLEAQLAKQEIRLNEEKIEEGLFSLHIKNVYLYAKGIEVAKIKELSLFTLLFYNSIEIKEIVADEALHSKVPAFLQKATLEYHLLNPSSLSVDANGSFGHIAGKIEIPSGMVHLDFVQNGEIDMLKPFLKKDEKGWFYEGSF